MTGNHNSEDELAEGGIAAASLLTLTLRGLDVMEDILGRWGRPVNVMRRKAGLGTVM